LAAEVLAEGADGDSDRALGLLELETGPATPKVDVRAAVFRGAEILLVRETEDGLWSVPGGWADAGEPPSRAAEREVFEESGFRVRATKLVALLDRDRQGHVPPIPYSVYKAFFLCEVVNHEAGATLDSGGAGFFVEDALPPLSLGRVTEAQVRCLFRHHRDPTLPAGFD